MQPPTGQPRSKTYLGTRRNSTSSVMDISSVISVQNRDGGWSYHKGGGSWTEPTVFALLAQRATKPDLPSVERGLAWLRAAQRQDGGWPPRPSVSQSTWVTAVAALLSREDLGLASHARAIEWLMGQAGQETSSFVYKLRNELLGNVSRSEERRVGEECRSRW